MPNTRTFHTTAPWATSFTEGPSYSDTAECELKDWLSHSCFQLCMPLPLHSWQCTVMDGSEVQALFCLFYWGDVNELSVATSVTEK